MSATRILLVGYYGKGNFGDDVLLKVAYGLIKNALPSAQIYVVAEGDYVSKMLPDVKRLMPGRNGNFDIIIHGGGGVFFDFSSYGFRNKIVEYIIELLGWRCFIMMEKFLRKMLNKPSSSAAKRLGLGIGVGSFSRGSYKLLRYSLPILADFDALWLRDEKSNEYLKRFKSILKAQIINGSDLAFFVEYWLNSKKTNNKSQRPKLGIILRDWPQMDCIKYAEIIATLSKDYEINGFIFDKNNDVKSASLFAPYKKYIWQPETMNMGEFISIIAEQDVLLTSRAHGAICGACLLIPAVILNIEPKLEQIHVMLKNSTIMVNPNETVTWQEAIRKAQEIKDNSITADIQKNRQASEAAFNKIKRWF